MLESITTGPPLPRRLQPSLDPPSYNARGTVNSTFPTVEGANGFEDATAPTLPSGRANFHLNVFPVLPPIAARQQGPSNESYYWRYVS